MSILNIGPGVEFEADQLFSHADILGTTNSGKSFCLYQINQELAVKEEVCQLYLDPSGDGYERLVDFCHANGLSHRLVLVDPYEDDLIVGVNPLAPWPKDLESQASVQSELLLRSMGVLDTLDAPQMAQWFTNTIYAWLSQGLTYADAGQFLSLTRPAFRNQVIEALPDGELRDQWEWASAVMASGQRNAADRRLVNEILGPVLRRLQSYVLFENLRLMLGSPAHLDVAQCMDEKKIVLVNLQRKRGLSLLNRRLLGLQIVSAFAQEAFRRREAERRPVFITLDEAQHFFAPELEEILREARKYQIGLILAHQSLADLIDRKTQDRRLLDLVLGCCHTKIIFQVLSPSDRDLIAQTIFGHHLDPDRVKNRIWSPRQLSHVTTAVDHSSAVAASVARATTRTRTTTRAHGHSSGENHLSGSSSGGGSGDGLSTPIMGVPTPGAMGTHTVMGTSSHADSDAHGDSSMDFDMEGEADSVGETETGGTTLTRGSSEHLMVVPGEVFRELTSVEFMGLEEQLYRMSSTLARLPQGTGVFSFSGGEPVPFPTTRLGDLFYDEAQRAFLNREHRRRAPAQYLPRDTVRAYLLEKHVALSSPPAIIDTEPTYLSDEEVETARARKRRSVG